VATLALAIHSDRLGPDIERTAADAVANASDTAMRWAGLAAAIALLALSMVAVRTGDRAMCARARSLAERLLSVPSERERADALASLLQEHCKD
jgi:uncharacterized protein YjeT (DUF2065 family)